MPLKKNFVKATNAAQEWTDNAPGWRDRNYYGEQFVHVPEKIQDLALVCAAHSKSIENFIKFLIPEIPSRPDWDKLSEDFRAGKEPWAAYAPVAKDHGSIIFQQQARLFFGELIRFCIAPIATGNADGIRQFATCLEAIHEAKKGPKDPVLAALYVRWTSQNGGNTTKKAVGNMFNVRFAELLGWVQRIIKAEGSKELCSATRLRRAMDSYGFTCLPTPKGGKRKGAGRKPI